MKAESSNKYWNSSQIYIYIYIAPPSPTLRQERVFTPHKQMPFSALHTYVRKLHLWHTERKNNHKINQ